MFGSHPFARMKTCFMHYHTPFLAWEIRNAIKQVAVVIVVRLCHPNSFVGLLGVHATRASANTLFIATLPETNLILEAC